MQRILHIMELAENEHVQNIGKILEMVGEQVEGNLVCDKHHENIIIDENLNKIRNLQYMCRGKKKIIEIGINACHSLLIMLLENPEAEYLLFDLNYHRYTEPTLYYLASAFPNTKISVYFGNSVETITNYINAHPEELNTYDLCHLDGGHTEDIFSVDYENMKKLVEPGAKVIFDDYDYFEIRDFLDKKLNGGDIREYYDKNLNRNDRHLIYRYSGN